MKTSPKTIKRQVRKNRIRSKVSGTSEKPRLAVFKSNKYIYAELINDDLGVTLASASSLKITGKKANQAQLVGEAIAKKAIENKISKVVFDRGGYIYTGRVKALADAARSGGLEF
ncbi:MAG: ribosomal protein [Candidatus Taylorbacteria bacterium]|nr:ribosomal protein [Candidatus Taylorbacteria bacterium]